MNRKLPIIIVMAIVILAVGGYALRDKLLPPAPAPLAVQPAAAPAAPGFDAARFTGKTLEGDDYAALGLYPMGESEIPASGYRVAMVIATAAPRQSAVLLLSPAVLDEAGPPGTANAGRIPRRTILDAAPAPSFDAQGLRRVMPDEKDACRWHDSPLAAVVGEALGVSQPVKAAWRFDLSAQHIVSVAPEAADCAVLLAAQRLGERREAFMTHGWDFDTEHGVEGLRKLGKVLSEKSAQLDNEHDPAQKDETYALEYDGLKVEAYQANIPGAPKTFITGVDVTDAKWPVKFGLGIGASREQVIKELGAPTPSPNGKPGKPDELRYEASDEGGEASYGAIFSLDAGGKVSKIQWYLYVL